MFYESSWYHNIPKSFLSTVKDNFDSDLLAIKLLTIPRYVTYYNDDSHYMCSTINFNKYIKLLKNELVNAKQRIH